MVYYLRVSGDLYYAIAQLQLIYLEEQFVSKIYVPIDFIDRRVLTVNTTPQEEGILYKPFKTRDLTFLTGCEIINSKF